MTYCLVGNVHPMHPSRLQSSIPPPDPLHLGKRYYRAMKAAPGDHLGRIGWTFKICNISTAKTLCCIGRRATLNLFAACVVVVLATLIFPFPLSFSINICAKIYIYKALYIYTSVLQLLFFFRTAAHLMLAHCS